MESLENQFTTKYEDKQTGLFYEVKLSYLTEGINFQIKEFQKVDNVVNELGFYELLVTDQNMLEKNEYFSILQRNNRIFSFLVDQIEQGSFTLTKEKNKLLLTMTFDYGTGKKTISFRIPKEQQNQAEILSELASDLKIMKSKFEQYEKNILDLKKDNEDLKTKYTNLNSKYEKLGALVDNIGNIANIEGDQKELSADKNIEKLSSENNNNESQQQNSSYVNKLIKIQSSLSDLVSRNQKLEEQVKTLTAKNLHFQSILGNELFNIDNLVEPSSILSQSNQSVNEQQPQPHALPQPPQIKLRGLSSKKSSTVDPTIQMVIDDHGDMIRQMEYRQANVEQLITKKSDDMNKSAKLLEENYKQISNTVQSLIKDKEKTSDKVISKKFSFIEHQFNIIGEMFDVLGFTNDIITTPFEKLLFKNWFGVPFGKLKVVLIYKAKEGEDKGENFHNNCNGKPKTLTLIKTVDGYKFGGYVEKEWKAYYDKNKPWEGICSPDSSSFLFSLNNQKKYKIKENGFALFNNTMLGPSFGDLGLDLQVKDNFLTKRESFCNDSEVEVGSNEEVNNEGNNDKENNNLKYANPSVNATESSYDFGKSNASKELNGGQKFFMVEELEVYQVKV